MMNAIKALPRPVVTYAPLLLTLASFVLQVLVSVGLPRIISIDFLRFDLSFYQFSIFGIWSICTGTPAETLFDGTVLTPAGFNCAPSSLGWTESNYSSITDKFFSTSLAKALVLHPVAAGLTFLTLPALLWALRRPRRGAVLASLLSTLITLVAFIIDLALFVPAHMRLRHADASETLGQAVMDVRYGAAFWLAMIATICSVLASLCVCAAHRMHRRESDWSYESRQIITSSDRPPSRSLIDEKNAGSERTHSRAASRSSTATPLSVSATAKSDGEEIDYGRRGRRRAEQHKLD